MDRIECVKTVSTSGHSMILPLTKELRMLGIEKGDNIKITIEKIN